MVVVRARSCSAETTSLSSDVSWLVWSSSRRAAPLWRLVSSSVRVLTSAISALSSFSIVRSWRAPGCRSPRVAGSRIRPFRTTPSPQTIIVSGSSSARSRARSRSLQRSVRGRDLATHPRCSGSIPASRSRSSAPRGVGRSRAGGASAEATSRIRPSRPASVSICSEDSDAARMTGSSSHSRHTRSRTGASSGEGWR